LQYAPEPLFRPEAFASRVPRLYGDVTLATPPAWQVLGYLLFAMAAAFAVFIAVMTYTRVESATGRIVLDRGVVPVVPSRPGIVLEIMVRNGQTVAAGAPLARILASETAAQGGLVEDRVLEAIARQERGISDQGTSLVARAAAERSRALAQVAGAEQELRALDRQIAVQREMVASTRSDLESVGEVARKGYISQRDLNQRRMDLLERQQRLAGLEQARAARMTALVDTQRSISQSNAQASGEVAQLGVADAELAQRRISTQAAREYVVTATVPGTVTGVSVHPGQTAGVQGPLLTIIPAGSRPRVELHVPTRAAGFLQKGQEVRIAVDALPYQQFGRLRARISELSEAAVDQPGERGPLPVYVILADIEGGWRSPAGRRFALLPGMTLSAEIVTSRERLIYTLLPAVRPDRLQ
jgi:membrane fusion protein